MDAKTQTTSRFDFEQQIMDCWGVVDDIKTVYNADDLRELSKDEMQNLLLGLYTMYQLKFEILFKMFEDLCQQRAI
jgi:hypothetical protein